MPTNNVDQLYTLEFNNNLQLLSQQEGSRLKNSVMTGSHKGEQARPVDELQSTTVSQRITRFEDKVNTDIVNDRRWVLPTSYATHSMVDDFDRIRMMVQLDSGYLKNQKAAMNRQKDDEIIGAFFTASQTGKQGGTSTSFPAANIVAVGSTDLTVAKLLSARQLLFEGEVDIDTDEEIFCAITPHQENTLINEAEINNASFREREKLPFNRQNGMHGTTWFGITFIMTNRLLDTAGTLAAAGTSATRNIPFWAKSGMHLGLWNDLEGRVVQRFGKVKDPFEMSVYATFGATRLEEAKVIKIICDET